MIITANKAWQLARKKKRNPPYEGYAMDLDDGRVLLCKFHRYYLIEFPTTEEQVRKFEEENKELIASLPEPDTAKFLARLKGN